MQKRGELQRVYNTLMKQIIIQSKEEHQEHLVLFFSFKKKNTIKEGEGASIH
jgi:hypothetical protein